MHCFSGQDETSFVSRVQIAKSIINLPKYNLLALINAQGLRVSSMRELDGIRDAWLNWLDACQYSTFSSYHDAWLAFSKHFIHQD